jgi:hypothetical protein
MRPLIGSIAGGGSAAAVSLASWPIIVLIANSQLVSAIGLPPPAVELVWGLSLGILGGLVGTLVGGQASTRTWPATAYGSWFIWSLLLMALTALRFVPVLFAFSAIVVAGATALTLTRVWRPGALPRPASAVLIGIVGFTSLFVALVALLFVAMQLRPRGVTPEVWRAYMNAVDLVAIAALVAGAVAASAIGAATGRRLTGGFVSLATYACLVMVTTPILGFLSACYAGEAFIIFGWLGSFSC